MMNVNGIGPTPPAKPIEPVAAVPEPIAAPPPQAISDTVEISNVAALASKIVDIPDIRTELVQRVKTELAAGTYETPERIEIAVNRLMDDLLGVF